MTITVSRVAESRRCARQDCLHRTKAKGICQDPQKMTRYGRKNGESCRESGIYLSAVSSLFIVRFLALQYHYQSIIENVAHLVNF